MFGAIILAGYVSEYEIRVAEVRWATPLLFMPAALIFIGLFHYRKKHAADGQRIDL
jgi:hypothetical protein